MLLNTPSKNGNREIKDVTTILLFKSFSVLLLGLLLGVFYESKPPVTPVLKFVAVLRFCSQNI